MIQLKPSSEASSDLFSVFARNVMGTYVLPLEIDRGVPVADLTRSIVEMMSLPDDCVWDLRDEGSSAFLDPSRPVGEQVEAGARLTVTPKTHLG